MNDIDDTRPNCWHCRHFLITHFPATPYACRRMGFQSQAMPGIEVLRATGHTCLAFSLKPELCRNSGTKEMNT